MSVHGEYERSLEILILHLAKLSPESGQIWIEAFSALRMKHQPDLSTAARECLALLDRAGTEIPTLGTYSRDPENPSAARASAEPLGNILGETASNLRAHCRAILGVSALNQR